MKTRYGMGRYEVRKLERPEVVIGIKLVYSPILVEILTVPNVLT